MSDLMGTGRQSRNSTQDKGVQDREDTPAPSLCLSLAVFPQTFQLLLQEGLPPILQQFWTPSEQGVSLWGSLQGGPLSSLEAGLGQSPLQPPAHQFS